MQIVIKITENCVNSIRYQTWKDRILESYKIEQYILYLYTIGYIFRIRCYSLYNQQILIQDEYVFQCQTVEGSSNFNSVKNMTSITSCCKKRKNPYNSTYIGVVFSYFLIKEINKCFFLLIMNTFN